VQNNQRDYQSYLLRIWRVGARNQLQLRLTLEDTLSGEVKGFDDLEKLVEYLRFRDAIKQEETEKPEYPHRE
jgi:hypothetical protein